MPVSVARRDAMFAKKLNVLLNERVSVRVLAFVVCSL